MEDLLKMRNGKNYKFTSNKYRIEGTASETNTKTITGVNLHPKNFKRHAMVQKYLDDQDTALKGMRQCYYVFLLKP